MLEEAWWKKANPIIAVTLASSGGDSAYYRINGSFKRLTGGDCVLFDSSALHNDEKLKMLLTAKIIFIGGGDQSASCGSYAEQRQERLCAGREKMAQ